MGASLSYKTIPLLAYKREVCGLGLRGHLVGLLALTERLGWVGGFGKKFNGWMMEQNGEETLGVR